MGKGDKKTKRGKIVIGSSGVTRLRKKKKNIAPVAVKSRPKKEAEEQMTPPAKTAAKKTAKKAEASVEGSAEKPKAAKTKKKAAEPEVTSDAESTEPQQD